MRIQLNKTVCTRSYNSRYISYILSSNFYRFNDFGALAGTPYSLFRVYKWRELDSQFVEGIKIMSFIGVVILSANGFAGVMNATGDIEKLVSSLTDISSGHKLLFVIMYIIGLIVTLGIGSSFATIPIIARHYLFHLVLHSA